MFDAGAGGFTRLVVRVADTAHRTPYFQDTGIGTGRMLQRTDVVPKIQNSLIKYGKISSILWAVSLYGLPMGVLLQKRYRHRVEMNRQEHSTR